MRYFFRFSSSSAPTLCSFCSTFARALSLSLSLVHIYSEFVPAQRISGRLFRICCGCSGNLCTTLHIVFYLIVSFFSWNAVVPFFLSSFAVDIMFYVHGLNAWLMNCCLILSNTITFVHKIICTNEIPYFIIIFVFGCRLSFSTHLWRAKWIFITRSRSRTWPTSTHLCIHQAFQHIIISWACRSLYFMSCSIVNITFLRSHF